MPRFEVTAEDGRLLLNLYELRREPVLRQARDWFAGQFEAASYAEFERLCPRGSDNNRFFRMVTSYWDMAAAIVVQGALNEELFFEATGEHLLVWRKIAAWVGELRQARNLPRYLHNLEELAARHQRYLAERA